MIQLSTVEVSVGPPQGSVLNYTKFLKLLESRKVTKVDKAFLRDQNIASGNEPKFISGLKFLGLIDKDGNATSKMDDLCTVGEKRKENLAAIIRSAYFVIFDGIKLDLEKADSDTLINTFKTDYKMGSIRTAEEAAKIFVFLAQQADIALSPQIVDNLSVNKERATKISGTVKKPKTAKTKSEREPLPKSENEAQESLPEEALARFTLKGVGYVDIKDKDTFELAKAYMNVLSKRLGIADS